VTRPDVPDDQGIARSSASGDGLAGHAGALDPLDWRGWRYPLLVGFGWAVAARVAAMLVATGARWMLQAGSQGPAPLGTALSVWRRWDASNLAEIAEHGYLSPTSDPAYPPYATAYFPGFPLLLRGAGWLVGGDLTLAGLVVNLVATGVALAALYRLGEERIGPGAGHIAAGLLAFAPLAVFLVAGYSEPLFLAGAVPAWYLASRGRWWAASVPAAVAMSARTVGLALIAGLAVEYLAQRRFRPRSVRLDALSLLAAATPLLAWMAWLWWRTGDALRFVHDQKAGWGRELTLPGEALENTVTAAYRTVADTTWVFTWRLELVGVVIGLSLLVWCLLHRSRTAGADAGADAGAGVGAAGAGRPEWAWAAYTAATLAAYLLSTWYFSVPRGLLGLFPLPLLLAGALRRRPQLAAIVLAISAGLFSLGVTVFVRGPWVG